MNHTDLQLPNLNDAQQAIISGSTPQKYIKKRPGRGGQQFDYVEVGYVIQTLNQAFGFSSWEFKIIDKQIGNDSIWVQGSLTIHFSPSYAVTKENFGGSEVKKNSSTGKPVDIGDDLKSASADALKKCASMFGVAADIYFPQLDRSSDEEDIKPMHEQVRAERVERNNICSECGVEHLLDKVADYSTNKYGRILCYSCQQAVQ